MTEPRACPGYDCQSTLRESEFLCRRCVRRAERVIGDLTAEAHELDTTITRQAKIGGGHKRMKGDEAPLPWNENAASKGDDALALLYEWADHIAQWFGEPGLPVRTTNPAGGREPLVRLASAILLRHIDWLGPNEQSADLAHAMWVTRSRVRSLTDRPLERVWAGPCHALQPATVTEHDGLITVSLKKSRCQLDLYRAWGAETLICDGHNDPDDDPGCGAVHAIDDRRKRWMLAAVDEHLVPLKDVWENLPLMLPADVSVPPWDTVRKWTQWREIKDSEGKVTNRIRPRLHPRTVTTRGVKLYRGRDILELVADEQPRAGRRRRTRRGKVAS